MTGRKVGMRLQVHGACGIEIFSSGRYRRCLVKTVRHRRHRCHWMRKYWRRSLVKLKVSTSYKFTMSTLNPDQAPRFTKDIRCLVCHVGEKEIFRIKTFRAKCMEAEADRRKHGCDVWAAVERLTSQPTRDKAYMIAGGTEGEYAQLEDIVSEVYVLPFIDQDVVHASLKESASQRYEYHLHLKPKIGRGTARPTKTMAVADFKVGSSPAANPCTQIASSPDEQQRLHFKTGGLCRGASRLSTP